MNGFRALLANASVILRREPWWAEFWSAVTALAWAGLSYISTDALAVWPSMRVLLRIGDDRFWHLTGFGLGAMQLVFLLCNHRWWRWGAAILLCWFWAVLTLGIWVATPWSPATAVYAGWFGVNVFSILRHLHRAP